MAESEGRVAIQSFNGEVILNAMVNECVQRILRTLLFMNVLTVFPFSTFIGHYKWLQIPTLQFLTNFPSLMTVNPVELLTSNDMLKSLHMNLRLEVLHL